MKEDMFTNIGWMFIGIIVTLFVVSGYIHFNFGESLLWYLTPVVTLSLGILQLILFKRVIKTPTNR